MAGLRENWADCWQYPRCFRKDKADEMESTGMAPDATDTGPFGAAQESPAVSIVVPCYNGGRFLDALMASLAQQTFQDFEIIIVDDGSTEDETLRKLAALEDRVRVVHQDNRGPSAARNIGVSKARADIVAMLDCDDTIEPTYLAETVPALRSAPPGVAMAVTHMRTAGGQTGVGRRYFNRFDLLFTNTLSVGLVLRKEAWSAVGGYDETMREGYEDWDFSLRLADAGYRGIEVPRPLYIYYIRPDATWLSRSSDVNTNHMHAKLWRSIRSKHVDSYRPLAILRLWCTSRDGSGVIPLWKGLAAYVLTLLLPDAWFSQLITGFRNRTHSGRRSMRVGSTLQKMR
jgi:glycosyltransferase involved in cell wall biosynthesis